MIGLVKMRQLDVDENYALRGHTLERAIEVNICKYYEYGLFWSHK